MKICFIWVEKFRNFENFGFNLSSSNKFKFDPSKNILKVEQIEPLPNDFFGSRITDVIGIIGKNGSGKSNSIELICKILKGSKTSLQTDFLFVIEENNELICYYSFSNHPKANFPIRFEKYNGSINPLKVVFFSNVFDERRTDFSSEVADISVNNLHRKNLFAMFKPISSFEKQIKLITSKVFPTLGIDIPTKAQLISRVWASRFNSSTEREIFGYASESVKKLKRIYRDRLRDMKPENKFIHLFRYGYFFETLATYSRVSRSNEPRKQIDVSKLNEFILSLFNLRTEEISEKLITYIETELLSQFSEQTTLFPDENQLDSRKLSYEKIRKQIDFIRQIKLNLEVETFKYDNEGSRNRELEYFTFEYDYRKSNNFISEYINLFGNDNIFDIDWVGISSGHKAYLNLFSSIYQELRYTRILNLVLCIDEGDLYLHPKWQMEFFDRLLTILPLIYSGNIQLVLTTHSPFLLSDLPKQNITILDKDMKGSSMDGIKLRTNTFGGNLYDLYSEPFFIGNKKISDFANSKITEFIDLIESKKLTLKERKAALKFSELIGDEIIKFGIKKILEND